MRETVSSIGNRLHGSGWEAKKIATEWGSHEVQVTRCALLLGIGCEAEAMDQRADTTFIHRPAAASVGAENHAVEK